MTQYAADEVRGRVGALHRSITISSYAISSSLLAVVANHVGLRATLVGTGLVSAAFFGWSSSRHAAFQIMAATDKRKPSVEEVALENAANLKQRFRRDLGLTGFLDSMKDVVG
jgi:hypothetical protein